MSITVVCGTCGSKLKAPGSAAGRGVKCPKCAAELTVPATINRPVSSTPALPVQPNPPAASTPDRPTLARAARPAPPSRASRDSGYGDSEGGYKECPFCGEDVRAKARVCKHCGETLDVALRAAEEAKRDSRRGRDRVNVRRTVYIDDGRGYAPTKSVLLALILSFLFGPLGMLYATVAGAVVMFLVNLILLIPTAGLIVLLTWPAGMLWSVMAVSDYNARR